MAHPVTSARDSTRNNASASQMSGCVGGKCSGPNRPSETALASRWLMGGVVFGVNGQKPLPPRPEGS